jgi:hypothetical protein
MEDHMKATFVFAVYLDELRTSWRETISEVDLINLLYDAVSEPANLKNQKGETISVKKGTASKIFHRNQGGNVNRSIRQHSHDQSVLSTIDEYFEKHVVRCLLPGSEENLIYRLDHHIQVDQSIAVQVRNELHKLAQKETLARFLARAFIQSLQPDNVLKSENKKANTDGQEEAKRHPLQSEIPPGPSSANESRYTKALMKVYAEDARVDSITEKDLDGPYVDYKPHFTRQRSDYFAAEAIRRGTRDFYGDDEEEYFTILEKEIFDGIIDVWENPSHDYGFARLRETLAAAIHAPVDQCWLARDTVWIGNAQKKGVCHVLVNEGKLEGWVIKRGAAV